MLITDPTKERTDKAEVYEKMVSDIKEYSWFKLKNNVQSDQNDKSDPTGKWHTANFVHQHF